MTRRDLLSLGGGAVGAICLTGCSQLAAKVGKDRGRKVALPTGSTDATVRLVNRTSFGPRPGDIARVKELGREAYVEEQLAADLGEEPRLTLLLHRVDSLRSNGMELGDVPQEEMAHQLQKTALLRAVYGRNQLKERLCDLWTNHFNIYALKARGAYLLAHDETSVIREHALGKFPDMVRASAHSPAMLAYLDSPQNLRGRPNENYARELLELHTLGVHGGYTQRDVMEVARCFTGWTVENRFLRPRGKFRFSPEVHDDGAKTVLGERIPAGGGEADANRVLDIVTRHPSTARFVAGKLCREFLGTSETLWRNRLANTYLETGGDIRAMLKPLLLSDDLLESQPIVKRPLDFVASALRATDADTNGERPLLKHLERMGQPLHQWPMPDGFPVEPTAWNGSLLGRWNFAGSLAENRIGGTHTSLRPLTDEAGGTAALVLGRKPSGDEPISIALSGKRESEAIAICLCSPEFQWR